METPQEAAAQLARPTSGAAVCPGTGRSTHMAEQGCAICHTPMPASSLQARWEWEALGKERQLPKPTTCYSSPLTTSFKHFAAFTAATWQLPTHMVPSLRTQSVQSENPRFEFWSRYKCRFLSITFLFCKMEIRITTPPWKR